MSRIGKKPILILNNIYIEYKNNYLFINCDNKNIYKKLYINSYYLNINISNNLLYLSISDLIYKRNKKKILSKANSYLGTMRSIINNFIVGINNEFNIKLILNGIGFKYQLNNNEILLNLGYSHYIKRTIPSNITIKYLNQSEMIISSYDKEKLKQFASEIKLLRKPDQYKGKGILYDNEILKLKESKKK